MNAAQLHDHARVVACVICGAGGIWRDMHVLVADGWSWDWGRPYGRPWRLAWRCPEHARASGAWVPPGARHG